MKTSEDVKIIAFDITHHSNYNEHSVNLPKVNFFGYYYFVLSFNFVKDLSVKTLILTYFEAKSIKGLRAQNQTKYSIVKEKILQDIRIHVFL